ncbi:MAG: DNA methyltransferase [Candidatus Hodarchaeota archaeon]
MKEKKNDKIELLDKDGSSRGYYDLKNRLNDLTGKEWVFSTKSVIPKSYPPSFQHKLRNEHGGQKPPELCAELISTFTKTNELVLDPFAGVGGTLIGSTLTSRVGVGVEINPRWIEIYHEVCELEGIQCQEMILANSASMVHGIRQEFDLILTDIPYWLMDKAPRSKGTFKRVNEEAKGVYSEKSKLSRFNKFAPKTKEEWLETLTSVFSGCYKILRNKRYCVVFVGNMYYKGAYHLLTSDVSQCLEVIGFVLKGEIVWYDVAKKLHLYGINYEWIPSMVHQNILVFFKDEKNAPKIDGEIVKTQNFARISKE